MTDVEMEVESLDLNYSLSQVKREEMEIEINMRNGSDLSQRELPGFKARKRVGSSCAEFSTMKEEAAAFNKAWMEQFVSAPQEGQGRCSTDHQELMDLDKAEVGHIFSSDTGDLMGQLNIAGQEQLSPEHPHAPMPRIKVEEVEGQPAESTSKVLVFQIKGQDTSAGDSVGWIKIEEFEEPSEVDPRNTLAETMNEECQGPSAGELCDNIDQVKIHERESQLDEEPHDSTSCEKIDQGERLTAEHSASLTHITIEELVEPASGDCNASSNQIMTEEREPRMDEDLHDSRSCTKIKEGEWPLVGKPGDSLAQITNKEWDEPASGGSQGFMRPIKVEQEELQFDEDRCGSMICTKIKEVEGPLIGEPCNALAPMKIEKWDELFSSGSHRSMRHLTVEESDEQSAGDSPSHMAGLRNEVGKIFSVPKPQKVVYCLYRDERGEFTSRNLQNSIDPLAAQEAKEHCNWESQCSSHKVDTEDGQVLFVWDFQDSLVKPSVDKECDPPAETFWDSVVEVPINDKLGQCARDLTNCKKQVKIEVAEPVPKVHQDTVDKIQILAAEQPPVKGRKWLSLNYIQEAIAKKSSKRADKPSHTEYNHSTDAEEQEKPPCRVMHTYTNRKTISDVAKPTIWHLQNSTNLIKLVEGEELPGSDQQCCESSKNTLSACAAEGATPSHKLDHPYCISGYDTESDR